MRNSPPSFDLGVFFLGNVCDVTALIIKLSGRASLSFWDLMGLDRVAALLSDRLEGFLPINSRRPDHKEQENFTPS